MAKPTKYATLICSILTILAIIGIVVGLLTGNTIVTMILLLPAIIYEVYRTEGASTKWASWGLLLLFLAEIVLIVFKIEFNVAEFLNLDSKYIRGYRIPLGDVKSVVPALMAVLSGVLFTRTRGVYTKWLSVIIFVTSLSVIYILDPDIFQMAIKLVVEQM